MIWHSRKISGSVTSGDWNQDPHEVDVDALRKALKIGSGESGGSGDGVWTLIEDLEFSSPATSFTVQNLQAYEQLYFLFSFDLQSSEEGDNSIIMYPNGDTGANYVCTLFHFNNTGITYKANHPSPNMHICIARWRTRSLGEGYAYLHTKVTGYWRALHTRFTTNPYNHVYYGAEQQVGYWKNTEDPINNIQFKVRQSGYPFTGWIKIYGLK